MLHLVPDEKEIPMDRQRTDLFTLLMVVAAVVALALGVNHAVQAANLCADFDPSTEFETCFTDEVRP